LELPPTLHRNNWRTTMLLFALTGLVESLAFGHLSAFTPLYLRDLHVQPDRIQFWTGILSSLGFVIGLPLLPLWAVWSEKYGRKIIIVRSSVFAALIYGLFAAAKDVNMLAVARFFGGFVLGNTGVMMAVQAEITPRERLGSTVALISAGAPVGMAIGPILGGAIIKNFGLRWLFWLDTGLTALIVLALIAILKEEPRAPREAQTTRAGIAEAMRAIAHTPAVVALFIVTFLMAFGISMAQPYIPLLIEELYHGPRINLPPTIGTVLTMAGIAMALATPIWGTLGDKAGHLRVLRLCGITVGLALAGQALAMSVWQVGVSRAAQGLCQGGLSALAMVLLAFYAPKEKRSAILTLSLLPQQLAWFLGPLAGSLLVSEGLRLAFWGGAIAMVAGLAASLRLHDPTVETPTT
jgi:DHA1 family multidrug resistance protein-like MFS transporter